MPTDSIAGSGEVLLDTNVLVYCFDLDAPAKREIALRLTQSLFEQGRVALTVQVLNEFANTVTHPKKSQNLPIDVTAHLVQSWTNKARILPLTPNTTLAALGGMRHGLSFWDALIWAAAKENGVGLIYTEDFQHGRDVEGVRFENPFLANAPPQP